MKKEEILKYLNLKLKECFKENPEKVYDYCVRVVLEQAKKDGVIKDYRWTQEPRVNGRIYFGSCGRNYKYKVYLHN